MLKKRQLFDSKYILRLEYLKKCGYIVLRFWEDEIKNNEEEIYDIIKRAIQ